MTKKDTKKNRKTKKIFLAILMILFTGVVLSASTYAWFTANRTVTVNQVDVNVAAENGLQLSVDGTNWKPAITNEDIIGASANYTAAVNQLPTGSIVPVSTVGEVDPATGFMNMYAGSIETNLDHYIVTANKSTETNTTTSGSFVAFDLFFRTTAATTIYMTDNSAVTAKSGPLGLQNAARVAFVTQGNTTVGDTLPNIQGLKATTNDAVKIWEPNYDVHTEAAVNNARDNYGISTTTTGGSRLTYVGVKAPIPSSADTRLNSTSNTYFGAVTPAYATVASGIPNTGYLEFANLSAGITKIRIYMWVEGQDVDCENNASGSSISFNLQFSMNDKA